MLTSANLPIYSCEIRNLNPNSYLDSDLIKLLKNKEKQIILLQVVIGNFGQWLPPSIRISSFNEFGHPLSVYTLVLAE